jgi:hypothetical protein
LLSRGVAELKTKLDGMAPLLMFCEQHIGVSDGVQCGGATKGGSDLISVDGLSDMMHDDERGLGSFSQPQQGLAQSGHGSGVVFILIVSGVERVQDDDLRVGGAGGRQEMIESVGGVEQMSLGLGVDEQVLIGRGAQRLSHVKEPGGELLQGQLELTKQNPAGVNDFEPGPGSSGGEGQSEIGDKKGFPHFGFAADEQDSLMGQKARLDEARSGRRSLLD